MSEPSDSKFTMLSLFMVVALASGIIYLYQQGSPDTQAGGAKTPPPPLGPKSTKTKTPQKFIISDHERKLYAKLTQTSLEKIKKLTNSLGPILPPITPSIDSNVAVSAGYLAYAKQSARGKQLIIENLQKKRIIAFKESTSPDQLIFDHANQVALLADQKGDVYLYELPSGNQLTHISYKAKISKLALSAGGSHLGISGRGKPITLYQPQAKRIWQLPLSESATALALTDDGAYFAVATGSELKLYDSDKEILKASARLSSPIRALSFSPNKDYIAASHANGSVSIYELMYAEVIASIPSRNLINALAFSPDSRLLALGGEDKLVKIYDVSSMSAIKSIPHPSAVISLAFDPRARRLISSSVSKTEISTF